MKFLAKLVIAAVAAIGGTGDRAMAQTSGCNIANVLFGSVRIELIPKQGYETGIVFGNSTDGGRFARARVLGVIHSPERDGSRAVLDTDGNPCGEITERMQIVADCIGCAKGSYTLKSVSGVSLVVLHRDGSILGTIQGRLPR